MKTKQVRWYEGMLVTPHHFQAAAANSLDWQTTSQDWLTPYAYGVRSIELNVDSLANYEVRIPSIEARLRDGTLIAVPANAHLPALDVRDAFQDASALYVHLALPELRPGRANSTDAGATDNARHAVATETWKEQNTGGDSRDIDVHYLNARLQALPSIKSEAGYESLPLFRLRRSRKEGAVPEVDATYLPPLLACASCRYLSEDILQAICSQVGSYITTQADQLRTHGGWTAATLPQVHRAIMQLYAANSSYPLLVQLFNSRDLHPFLAYTELCRLVGQLSLVRNDWRPPDLPAYDHDDLGRVFAAVKTEIESILCDAGARVQVERYPFIGTGNWMEVGFEPEWFEPDHEFYIGIRSELQPAEVERLFADSHLDWKLGSSRTILQIYRNAEAGLGLRRYAERHPALPVLRDVTYFRIENTGPYWQQVVETPNLALKVNNRFVRGDATGVNTLTVVDPDGKELKVSLDLYVLKNA